jgi:hypothetical protein
MSTPAPLRASETGAPTSVMAPVVPTVATEEKVAQTARSIAVPGVITAEQVAQTARSIAAVQLPCGMVQWFEGGHADPWNHVEALMALAAAGLVAEAEQGYRWLEETQLPDGSWYNYYVADGRGGSQVKDPRRDTNTCAYVATGAWFHFLVTGDSGFLAWMWPTVESAIEFVLSLQQPRGEVLWCIEPDGQPGRFALLTGSSSILMSLRCAVAMGRVLGKERPEWSRAADRLGAAVANLPDAFEPKDRWAMDWYYPVLCGAVTGDAALARIERFWGDFVVPSLGVRCVSDRPWVTAAETAECVMALDAAGLTAEALELLGWAQFLRDVDGSYWTGWVFPDGVHFPGGERTSYTSAAIVLAAHALSSTDASAGIFRDAALMAG